MHSHLLSIVFFALSLPVVLGLPNQASPAEALRARSQPLERAADPLPNHYHNIQPSKPHEPHYPYPSKRHEAHYPYPSKRHEAHYPYPSKRHEAHYPYPSKRHEDHYPKPSKRPQHEHHEHEDDGYDEHDPHHAKRFEPLQESMKDDAGAEIDIPSYLCPMPASACPIERMLAAPVSLADWDNVDFECIDFQNEVRSCGACVSLGQGTDCTTIPGVHHVTCSEGQCLAHSCTMGYTLDASTHTCVSSQ